jgi:hypothetical protein
VLITHILEADSPTKLLELNFAQRLGKYITNLISSSYELHIDQAHTRTLTNKLIFHFYVPALPIEYGILTSAISDLLSTFRIGTDNSTPCTSDNTLARHVLCLTAQLSYHLLLHGLPADWVTAKEEYHPSSVVSLVHFSSIVAVTETSQYNSFLYSPPKP